MQSCKYSYHKKSQMFTYVNRWDFKQTAPSQHDQLHNKVKLAHINIKNAGVRTEIVNDPISYQVFSLHPDVINFNKQRQVNSNKHEDHRSRFAQIANHPLR